MEVLLLLYVLTIINTRTYLCTMHYIESLKIRDDNHILVNTNSG